MTRSEMTFLSGGDQCVAWHYPAQSSVLELPSGRPCVVMAHGFSGTRDAGLEGYAEGFARAGLDVVLFDYRGFGGSGGEPRQHVDYRAQREDYHAAVAAARRVDGVDPHRIVLWGTSYSGGHVLNVAAADQGITAVVSMTPAVDGLPILGMIARSEGVGKLLSLTAAGIQDRLGTRPRMLPAIGPAHSKAVIAKDGALERFQALVGPEWRNEVRARCTLDVAFNRPIRSAARVTVPTLIQVGELDSVVSSAAAERAARLLRGPATVLRYPVDHFDVYADPWLSTCLDDQVSFLHDHLSTSSARTKGHDIHE